jgi:predicted  nucleic acid-binding Zn-ribbon protein
MTPDERAQLTHQIERLNEASEEFRASRDQLRAAVFAALEADVDLQAGHDAMQRSHAALRRSFQAFSEANEAQVRSIDKVLEANRIALRLLNRENGTA